MQREMTFMETVQENLSTMGSDISEMKTDISEMKTEIADMNKSTTQGLADIKNVLERQTGILEGIRQNGAMRT